MNAQRLLMTCFVAALFTPVLRGAPAAPASPGKEAKEGDRASKATPAPKPTRADLEKQFEEMLTGATLEGVWQMTGKGGLRGNAPLTDPKKESYTIATVTKAGKEHWIVSARIQYADNDVTVPVLVRVVWAGDTPMITIDDLTIPMAGTYSARVMFHNGFYTGIWYSNSRNYGGVMAGRIVKPTDKPAPAEKSDNK